ncbi:hypothetical protein [Thermoactinomyces sp. DSM 45892]|nr:hypothetical protein [Thermoactinomyces sp. DSM 45892]SDY85786.1 hypothetical protein SAMN05444416_10990 [Thermoactinomyces sp. DSM 45892]
MSKDHKPLQNKKEWDKKSTQEQQAYLDRQKEIAKEQQRKSK